MDSSPLSFRRNAVQPLVCFGAGWDLVKSQYWVFVAISFIGILVGSAAAFGLLLGPMMCGLFIALFKRKRGETAEFGDLFKGFDYFGQSLVATLLHAVPLAVIIIPFYVLFYIGMLLTMPNTRRGEEVSSTSLIGFFSVMLAFGFVMMLLLILVSLIFTFAYPLIVDRKLSGIEAVKLSARAGLANFWRLLGLMLLNGVVGFVGVLLCYVGLFLALPLSFSAIAIAYDQVFGLAPVQSRLPPPPPTFFSS